MTHPMQTTPATTIAAMLRANRLNSGDILVGEHLRNCECSTIEARDMVLSIASGIEPEPMTTNQPSTPVAETDQATRSSGGKGGALETAGLGDGCRDAVNGRKADAAAGLALSESALPAPAGVDPERDGGGKPQMRSGVQPRSFFYVTSGG